MIQSTKTIELSRAKCLCLLALVLFLVGTFASWYGFYLPYIGRMDAKYALVSASLRTCPPLMMCGGPDFEYEAGPLYPFDPDQMNRLRWRLRFRHLRALERVVRIDFTGTPIIDSDLKHLEAFPHLSTVVFCDTKITDTGLRHLYALESLELIDLTDTKVTQEAVGQLKVHLPKAKVIFGKSKDRLPNTTRESLGDTPM